MTITTRTITLHAHDLMCDKCEETIENQRSPDIARAYALHLGWTLDVPDWGDLCADCFTEVMQEREMEAQTGCPPA